MEIGMDPSFSGRFQVDSVRQAAASKLAQFRKDTESHKRTSQMQEAPSIGFEGL